MSRLILEGNAEQIDLIIALTEQMSDVAVVELIPDESKNAVKGKKSPLYWLDKLRAEGGIQSIADPSAWQREIRSEDRVLANNEKDFQHIEGLQVIPLKSI